MRRRVIAMFAAGLLFDSGAVVASQQVRDLEAQADRLEAMADRIDAVGPIRPAGAADLALACRMHGDYRSRRAVAPPQRSNRAHQALFSRLRAMRWSSLPQRTRCGASGIVIFQPNGFGESVNTIGRSADGRFIGIGGGIQLAPLAGHGTECLYERRGGAFVSVGCITSWVS